MKQVEVTIMGQGYVLGCPDGGESLLAHAVSEVDREMSAIRDSGKVKARERIAVLAALNLAYQLAERRQSRADREAAAPAVMAADDGSIDVAQLVRRIDAVLDSDGHLL
jgi:cell division protein ZapA